MFRWFMRPTSDPSRFITFTLAACGVLSLAGIAPAAATGTVQVQQDDGSTQLYKNATIVVGNKTLRITTADKKGTLLIDRAACYLVDKVLTCLPYSMTLDQGGGEHPLDFQRGTVYLNTTDVSQPLPATSQRLPGNGIMLSLTTKIGTIVNVTGTIDKQTK
jgi:hypothetical protein